MFLSKIHILKVIVLRTPPSFGRHNSTFPTPALAPLQLPRLQKCHKEIGITLST